MWVTVKTLILLAGTAGLLGACHQDIPLKKQQPFRGSVRWARVTYFGRDTANRPFRRIAEVRDPGEVAAIANLVGEISIRPVDEPDVFRLCSPPTRTIELGTEQAVTKAAYTRGWIRFYKGPVKGQGAMPTRLYDVLETHYARSTVDTLYDRLGINADLRIE